MQREYSLNLSIGEYREKYSSTKLSHLTSTKSGEWTYQALKEQINAAVRLQLNELNAELDELIRLEQLEEEQQRVQAQKDELEAHKKQLEEEREALENARAKAKEFV